MTDTERVRGPLEFRAAADVDVNVRYAERIVEVRAVPYEAEAVVAHRGRMVRETIGRHAFAGAVSRPRRRLVHRDHDPVTGDKGPVVGIVRQLNDRADGLHAQLYIARSPLGEETLDWAADGILQPSIGFGVEPEHEQWSTDRKSRRITNAYLDHVALVPDQAYDAAEVLAVRAATRAVAAVAVPTPILDRIALAELAARYGYTLTATA